MVSPPHWLSLFANAAASHLYSHDVLSPLGCHFQQVKDVWEVTLFASGTEIVGGSEDGRTNQSYFNVDVKGVLELFSRIDAVSWQAQSLGKSDELGSHVAIEGVHDDQQVWLRITANAPERFDAGRRANVNQHHFEETW